ncbi:MAG: NitT/TauT family transport system permease protein [Bradyrhizobium sp.]|jgi:NitT/TauT family transport system permease protein|nr:NitT/TauT family transport system permease protein [Bradyrhizobium sp.]
MSRKADRLKHIALLVVVIGLWEMIAQSGVLPAIVLPAPSAIAARLFELFHQGDIWPHLLATTLEVLAGFALGVGAGFLFGVIVALVPSVEKFIYPYIVALQTVPKVAIAPLFLIWFGYGITSKIVIAALVCFFPVLVAVMSAFHTTDRDQLDMMKAFGASRWQTFRHLRTFAAMPTIFAGLEIASVFAVIGALVGEFVGAQAGLGYLIATLNFNIDVPGVFAVLIVLSLLGSILHAIVRYVGRRSVFWVRSERINIV